MTRITADVPGDVAESWLRQGWVSEVKHAAPRKRRADDLGASTGATNIAPGVEAYMPGDPSSQRAWAGILAVSTED